MGLGGDDKPKERRRGKGKPFQKEDPRRHPGVPFKKGNQAAVIPFDQKASLARIRDIWGTAKEEIVEFQNLIRAKPLSELEEMLNDSTLAHYKLLILKAFVLEVKEVPTLKTVDELTNLLAGPPVKSIELSGRDGEPLNNPLAQLTPEELLAGWRELSRQIKERECLSTQNQPPSLEYSPPSLPLPSDTES